MAVPYRREGVAVARRLAAELADLQSRGWQLHHDPNSGVFSVAKTFSLSAGSPMTVRVRERMEPGGVQVDIDCDDNPVDPDADGVALVVLLGERGAADLWRALDLLRTRLNGHDEK